MYIELQINVENPNSIQKNILIYLYPFKRSEIFWETRSNKIHKTEQCISKIVIYFKNNFIYITRWVNFVFYYRK